MHGLRPFIPEICAIFLIALFLDPLSSQHFGDLVLHPWLTSSSVCRPLLPLSLPFRHFHVLRISIARRTLVAMTRVEAPSAKFESRRLMSLSQFVLIAYFLTCGGPFGLDEAVEAGGVLFTIGGIILLPFIWSIPQSLMTAELSSMMSVNGGSLVWVWRGLGACVGITNAYNSLASALVDLCLYPNKIIEYMPFDVSPLQGYLVKLMILIVITMCNAVGLSVVGALSVFLMLVSMSGFFLEIPYAAPLIHTVDFTQMPTHVRPYFCVRRLS